MNKTFFCVKCLSDTLDVGTGDLRTFNGIGLTLIGMGPECPNCGSVVRRLFFCFGVPVFPFAKYRVIYLSSKPSGFLGTHSEFLSRRVGKSYKKGDAQPMLQAAAKLEDIDPAEAIRKYQEIIRRLPNTSARHEAERNIEVLKRGAINSGF